MGKYQKKMPKFLDTKTVPGLIGKSVALLVLPYVYLLLCGFVFDYLLKWYFMTGFIFYSLIVLYVLAVVLIVWLIVRFVKSGKRGV